VVCVALPFFLDDGRLVFDLADNDYTGGVMSMSSSQAIRAMAIFDRLTVQTKHEIYQEMLNLGLRIELKETTWHKHVRQRTKTAKGDLKRYFSMLTNFAPSDVQTFLDAFSEEKQC